MLCKHVCQTWFASHLTIELFSKCWTLYRKIFTIKPTIAAHPSVHCRLKSLFCGVARKLQSQERERRRSVEGVAEESCALRERFRPSDQTLGQNLYTRFEISQFGVVLDDSRVESANIRIDWIEICALSLVVFAQKAASARHDTLLHSFGFGGKSAAKVTQF
jgi:hypothetical protein